MAHLAHLARLAQSAQSGWALAGVAVCVTVPALALAAPDGLTLVSWSDGLQRVDLHLSSRLRWERWEAFAKGDDNIYGVRTRLGLEYGWQDHLRVFAESQLTNVVDLDSSATGAARLYRLNATNANANDVTSIRVRQLYAEARFDADNWLRVGRQDINVGTLIGYGEANWSYLKLKRLSQRLVGTVGWTNGERSYDGVTARLARKGHVLHLYAAEPTTGVFEVDSAYKRQRHLIFGGADWTVERGTWLSATELGAFFLAYSDHRDPSKVIGLFGDIEIYTLGASALGVYPLGPGNLDVVLWGALQLGDYADETPEGVRNLDHLAGALIAEIGYQLADCWGEPWLRLGVDFASGDDSPSDGDHGTFFNVLPTNHPYYGYIDQQAFSNLVDLLVQFRLAPLPKLGLELFFHQFWLHHRDDTRYFGTGAYTRTSLGYGRSPSNGSNNVGQEIDLVVSYQLNSHVGLMAGYSRLFGGGVFRGFPEDDASWAFTQLQLRY